MPSTYTTNNKLTKQGISENNNTWGTILNDVLNLCDQAFDGLTSVVLSGTSSTLTLTDGALADARNRRIQFTGNLSATHTVTIAPSVPKWYFMRNFTSGNQDIVITQGSVTVTIPSGRWMIVMTDGTNVQGMTDPIFPGNVRADSFTGTGAGLTNIPVSALSSVSHVRANSSTAQNIVSNAQTLVLFGNEDYDTLGEYAPLTSRFTAGITGYYRVCSTINLSSASDNGTLTLSVYKNGSLYAKSAIFPLASTTPFVISASIATTVQLNATDYVEIYALKDQGLSRALSGVATENYLTIDRMV